MRDTRQGARVPAPRFAALIVAAMLVLGACGGQEAPEIRDDSGLAWIAQGGQCMRESEEGPVRRVINRTDPELCGIVVKRRSPVYVRVVPPPGTRSR